MTEKHSGPALESWKEIAAYLNRDVTTVRRWEKTEGLPVHRHLHESRASVFAYRPELDAWLASRTPAPHAQEKATPRREVVRFATLAAALMVAAAASGDGLARPLETPAEAQGLTARQLWTGSSVDTTGALVPGSTRMSFVDWDTGDLAVRDLPTGWRFPIGPRFSPDGRFVTYDFPTGESGVERDIFLIAADGSGERPLVRHPANDYLPIWSPDGTRVGWAACRPWSSIAGDRSTTRWRQG